MDAKVAANDAAWAEADAAEALDFADWAVENAQLAILDAIHSRTYTSSSPRPLTARSHPSDWWSGSLSPLTAVAPLRAAGRLTAIRAASSVSVLREGLGRGCGLKRLPPGRSKEAE